MPINNSKHHKHLKTFGIVLIVVIIFILSFFRWLFYVSKQNTVNTWKNSVTRVAGDAEYYLIMPVHAIQFTAVQVEKMLDKDMPVETIQDYLVQQSGVYSNIIESNHTGIYGYCKGTYLNGSGWVPDERYAPRERPWYIDAIIANGEVAFVQPYYNFQTKTMMMSVSKMLSDGESVVSMDIFLDGLQAMVEKINGADNIDSVIVMADDGFVVSHSNPAEIGVRYLESKDEYKKSLAKNVLNSDESTFSLNAADKKTMVFSEKINNNWYVIFILDENKLFGSLQFIYLFSAVALLAAIISLLMLFYVFHTKYIEAEELSHDIQAVANIYAAVYRINIKTNHARLLRITGKFDPLMEGGVYDYNGPLPDLIKLFAADQSRDTLINFLDKSTYEERLRESNSLSHEFLDKNERWIRVQLIEVDRDDDGNLLHVMWAFESIDEDRKQRESLKLLAETDAMTGIKNRKGGEARIREAMAEGTKGMFILVDADHFKSVNDDFGHDVGDKVIITIADCLRRTFRDSDIVFRLGGDEFAAFAPTVETEEIGRRIIRRLYDNIEMVDIPEMKGRRITISVGATFYPADRNDSFDAMYQRADKGMYESKKQEGNALSFNRGEL